MTYIVGIVKLLLRLASWREAPMMQLSRAFPSVCFLDEKVYVTGGCNNLIDSTNWTEVFDTKTQTWECFQIRSEKICGVYRYKSVRCEGTIYVRSEETGVTYKLHRERVTFYRQI
ncbi:unnamed protein product [Thlaspi arvense]|uniref:FKB95-like N-terminal Kelch domain-containing protein n=1 Tax=Thlaspi arvense TaxID=13288 RepID=A0AAU9S017_THLAR|nr:unnamed protein product [Thlaspi arvense]